MKLYVVKNKQELSEKAYEIMMETVKGASKVTLGLATGGSPIGIYELFRNNKPEVSHVRTINLDEYIGLDKNHEQSYNYFMNDQLFNHLNFKETFVPNGANSDLDAECKGYDAIIDRHGIDLQLLGIGGNGHVAFNEPGTSFDFTTHVTDLVESTIDANSRYFENREDVPKTAITVGIKSIMDAKKILMIAYNDSKAQAIKEMIEGPVTTEIPASILQNHPDVTVIVDEDAAAMLSDETKNKYSV